MGPGGTVRGGAVSRWRNGGPDQEVDMGMEKQVYIDCKTFKRWRLTELRDS